MTDKIKIALMCLGVIILFAILYRAASVIRNSVAVKEVTPPQRQRRRATDKNIVTAENKMIVSLNVEYNELLEECSKCHSTSKCTKCDKFANIIKIKGHIDLLK